MKDEKNKEVLNIKVLLLLHLWKYLQIIKKYNREYKRELYHFLGSTKNDVNLVKLMLRFFLVIVIVKVNVQTLTMTFET